MKKIGLVRMDTSHPFTYGRVMDENPELGLAYTMVYDDGFRTDEEVEWFVKKCGMEGRAKTIEELADKTDVGFIQGCNWDKKFDYARPFIERGKPVFIDKPFVGSVKDIARVRELVKNGAKILGSSASRYAHEISDFLALPVAERGEILSVNIIAGVDEFNYASNACEALSEIADSRAVSCRYIGSAERDGGKCELFCVRFENGVVGTYCVCLTKWHPFRVTIMTTKTSCIFTIDSAAVYKSILSRLSESLHTDTVKTADVERLINVTEFMLCGKRSRDFENGREVKISELSPDDYFDGDEFERYYEAHAPMIYCDR
ncbi:MAG: Gfo/Idh/MocA family oxidoreductase [Oscillospiraceae bacterium]|nr:Gfo/Idh/MocA family oxidoreductase [Oscillospiraceae bacterium]